MSIANGVCLVTNEEGPCLVLPKGSFSPTRITYLSKEGCEKLVEVMNGSTDKVSGVCVIRRVHCNNCIYIPRGILNPRIRFLMSPEAIVNMAKDLDIEANIPVEPTPEPIPAPVEDSPPAEDMDLKFEEATLDPTDVEETDEEPVAIDEAADVETTDQIEVSEEVEVVEEKKSEE